MSKVNKKIKYSKRTSPLPALMVITFGCILLSAGIAYGWQTIEDKNLKLEGKPFSPATYRQEQEAASSKEAIDKEQSSKAEEERIKAEENAAHESTPSSDTTTSSSDTTTPISSVVVPQGDRVHSSYFDDAIFIGDSITTGIQLYSVMPNSTVLAHTGINLQSIMTKAVIKQGDIEVSIPDALSKLTPNKIYIMLGANGLAFLGPDETIKYYGIFIDEVKRLQPNSIIYIQSIMPIHEKKFSERYEGTLTNKIIDETNIKLIALSEEKDVYYVSPADVFKDESGGLEDEVTADGLHFNSSYYTRWMDYLKTHAITSVG